MTHRFLFVREITEKCLQSNTTERAFRNDPRRFDGLDTRAHDWWREGEVTKVWASFENLAEREKEGLKSHRDTSGTYLIDSSKTGEYIQLPLRGGRCDRGHPILLG